MFTAEAAGFGRELHALDAELTGTPFVDVICTGCSDQGLEHELRLAGNLEPGGSIELTLTGSTPGGLGLGFRWTGVPLAPEGLGCAVYLDSPVFLSTWQLDGGGAGSLLLALPLEPALAGLRVVLQAAVVEADGPLLGAFGTSNGFDVSLGD